MKNNNQASNFMNQGKVLEIIQKNQLIGRADIAKKVQLSIPAIMKITDSLLDIGMIEEAGKGESSGGKRPTLLKIVEDSFFSIGLDVGETKISCAIVDCGGNIHTLIRMNNEEIASAQEWIDRLSRCIENVLNQSKIPLKRILGIGVGMPGLINPQNSIVSFSPNLKLQNADIAGPLFERFEMPVILNNMTRAMAVGEKKFGVGRKTASFLLVHLGYGIAAALVADSEVYSGASGAAGELGHITVVPNGTLCDCGRRGCLQAVASGKAITREAQAHIRAGETSLIAEMVGNDIDQVSAKMVFDAAKQGDHMSKEIIDNAIYWLGMGISNICMMIDPESIVLEGGMTQSGEILIEGLEEALVSSKMPFSAKKPDLIVSCLGENAGVIGAAALVLERFFVFGANRNAFEMCAEEKQK